MIVRDPPHYLKGLVTTRTPKRLAYLDCEALVSNEHGTGTARWKAGCVGTTHWTSKLHTQKDTLELYKDPKDMWADVDAYCVGDKRVVLWAYDLPYQLRISQALVHLPARGFRLDKIVLEPGASWALFRDDKRSLMCCDLKSWFPVEFSKLQADVDHGERLRMDEPTKRRWSAAVAARRVEVIRSVVLAACDFIDSEQLGPFRPTGSGQSYAAYRRRFMSDRLLVHDDISRLQVEREAMWTGRAEAWRHGRVPNGPFVELDMRAAYCRIGAECEIPIQARSVLSRPNVDKVLRALERYSVLAQVTIDTDIPVVPAGISERVVWPVGKFTTWLWNPELTLAFEYANSVKVERAYTYTRAPAIRDFCQWVLSYLDQPESETPPIARRIVKHWSRTLVGRFGLRYRSWERFGEHPHPDLRLVTYLDHVDGIKTDMLIVGRDRMILSELTEGLESLPQVPGWIMSECRRRLWEAMTVCGLDNVAYVDTDSMIFSPTHSHVSPADIEAIWPGRWTTKGHYTRLHIYGPRNLEVNSSRRVSGLPMDARQTGQLQFEGDVLRSIKESMRSGQLDCVSTIPRKFVFNQIDLRRQHESDGTTKPYRLDQ